MQVSALNRTEERDVGVLPVTKQHFLASSIPVQRHSMAGVKAGDIGSCCESRSKGGTCSLQTGDTRRPQHPSARPRQCCHPLDSRHLRMRRLGNTVKSGQLHPFGHTLLVHQSGHNSSGLLRCVQGCSMDS